METAAPVVQKLSLQARALALAATRSPKIAAADAAPAATAAKSTATQMDDDDDLLTTKLASMMTEESKNQPVSAAAHCPPPCNAEHSLSADRVTLREVSGNSGGNSTGPSAQPPTMAKPVPIQSADDDTFRPEGVDAAECAAYFMGGADLVDDAPSPIKEPRRQSSTASAAHSPATSPSSPRCNPVKCSFKEQDDGVEFVFVQSPTRSNERVAERVAGDSIASPVAAELSAVCSEVSVESMRQIYGPNNVSSRTDTDSENDDDYDNDEDALASPAVNTQAQELARLGALGAATPAGWIALLHAIENVDGNGQSVLKKRQQTPPEIRRRRRRATEDMADPLQAALAATLRRVRTHHESDDGSESDLSSRASPETRSEKKRRANMKSEWSSSDCATPSPLQPSQQTNLVRVSPGLTHLAV